MIRIRTVTIRSVLALLLVSAFAATGCDKGSNPEKTGDKKSEEKKSEDKKSGDKADEKTAEKPAPKAELVEVDLSPWGPAWKGYVAMAPAGTKVTFDDPSRHLEISESDYVSVSEAPGFADAVKGLSKDPDNKNIVNVSPTEVTYERNPPLGKQWCFDTLLTVGKDKWSCAAESFTSAEVSKQMLETCKSIKKK
jgi:hypothetical protein